MTKTEQMEAIMAAIEGTTTDDLQTPQHLQEYLIRLTSWLASANEYMANAGHSYDIAKRDAYIRLKDEIVGKGATFAPSIAKDYIASLCSAQGANYRFAERTSRTITHTIEAMRSVISSKKAELTHLQYSGG